MNTKEILGDKMTQDFSSEVHLLAGKLVPIVVIYPLGGSRANRHHTPKSPSLILDNWWNLGLTFDLRIWIRWGSPIQVVELDDGHGEGDGHKKMDQVLHIWKKKKEKNKNGFKAKVFW